MKLNNAILLIIIIFGSVITVCSQFDFIYRYYGRNYVRITDYNRHNSRILGQAEAPSRYRLLSPWIQEVFLRVSPIQSGNSYEINSFIFRLFQNTAFLLVAWAYFRSFEFGVATSLLGLGILMYGMNNAFWQADLSCHTYTQLILLLLAGLTINCKRSSFEILILPLTILGALNREEAVFFPIMLLIARASPNWPWFPQKRTLVIGVVSLIAFVATYAAVHHFVGNAPYSLGRYGFPPGFENFFCNIRNSRTWLGLAQMYSFLPFVLLFWEYWPAMLRRYLIAVGIPWLCAQFIFGATDETRLFLGPLALIFIPAALATADETLKTQKGLPSACLLPHKSLQERSSS